jgi:hypothetical protein
MSGLSPHGTMKWTGLASFCCKSCNSRTRCDYLVRSCDILIFTLVFLCWRMLFVYLAKVGALTPQVLTFQLTSLCSGFVHSIFVSSRCRVLFCFVVFYPVCIPQRGHVGKKRMCASQTGFVQNRLKWTLLIVLALLLRFLLTRLVSKGAWLLCLRRTEKWKF